MSKRKSVKDKKGSILASWLISYLVILLIPLTTIFINYLLNTATIRRGLVNADELILSNLKSNIENDIQREMELHNYFLLNEQFQAICANREKNPKFYVDVRDLCRQIDSYCKNGAEIDCFVYLKNHDYIIGSNYANDAFYHYEGIRLTCPDMIPYESWKEIISGEYAKTFMLSRWINQKTDDGSLVYANTIHKSGTGDVNIFVSIPVQRIECMVEYLPEDTFFLLCANEQLLVIDHMGQTELPAAIAFDEQGNVRESKELICISAESENSDIRYYLVTTKKSLLYSMKDTRKSFIFSLILTLFFGVLGICVLLNMNYQPVTRFLKKAGIHDSKGNEFKRIENLYDQMLWEKEKSLKIISTQEERLQNLWLISVLKGRAVSFEEAKQQGSLCPEIKGRAGLAGFMIPSNDSAGFRYDELLFFVVNNVFTELMEKERFYHVEDGNIIFYVFDVAEWEAESWRQKTEEKVDYVCSFLREKMGCQINGAVSKTVENIENAASLYYDCVKELEKQSKTLQSGDGEVFRKLEGKVIVNKMLDYIEQHYTDQDFNVNSLAEALNRNPRYLTRSFKEVFGKGILDYINEKRITRAKELMKENHNTLEEVAQLVGYSNIRALRRNFVKMVGQNPDEYRRRGGI